MGNAILEKLKEFGLRHGEKAGVAVATGLFLVCIAMAANQKTIDTTPDKIKAAAKQSESNLNRREDRETIIKKLEEKGIKDSDFAQVVDEQVKNALVADNYKSAREWVTPEPGAGLLRETPKLIPPTHLYAYPGRGGFLVFALDKDGNRIPDTDKKDQAAEPRRRRRRRALRSAMGGMRGGMTGGMMGRTARRRPGRSKAEIEREDKVEQARKEKALKNLIAGEGQSLESDEQKKEEAQAQDFKEVVKGYRWIAITGELDHARLLANYRDALKNPATAYPHYKRLDLLRQALLPDGTWTQWKLVDTEKNMKILDNICEEDEELAPDNVRPEALVDPLPFLKNGLYEKVHVASLVPKEKQEAPKTQPLRGGGMMPGGMMPGGMMPGGGMMSAMADMTRNRPSSSQYSQMMRGGSAGMMMPGGGRRSGEMGGGMAGMFGGGGVTEAAVSYWKSDAKRVMIRALDFTAEEDTTYRYRARIVVFNPNFGREDVINSGIDTKSEELEGPWSEQTDVVTMPPDVMPYAYDTLPPSSQSDVLVNFQVVRFNPVDGATVPKTFDASPGSVVGELRTAEVPASDGSGKKSKPVDFNTRQIVLDIEGGDLQALPAGIVGPAFTRSALALLLRPDGSVAVHNEADDLSNEVRKDIDSNYRHEIAQSSKKRERSYGMGMMGMMGGMGGMGGMMMQQMMGGGRR